MINIIKDHYKNISIITIATTTGLISGALCQILLAKLLSVEKFGLYSTAMGFVNVLIPLSTIGIPVFLLKKYGEVKKEISPWSNKGLKTILISSTLFVLFLTTLSTQISQNDDYIKLIFSVSFLIIFNSIIEFQKYLFQINNKFQTFSWLKVSPFLLRVIFLAIIFLLGTKISPIIIGLVFSAIALVVSIFFFFTFERKKLKHFNYKKVFSKHNLGTKTLLLETLPFALNAVLYLTWSQGYVILTKYKFNDYNAGIFAIVVFIMTTVNLIPSTIFSKYITPKIHLAFYNNSTKIRDLFVKWNGVMFCFGIAVGLILYLLSPLFVSVFFGEKYSEVIPLVQLFTIAIPLRYMGLISGSILTTGNFIGIKNKALLIASVFNLTASIFLDTKYGIQGLIAVIIITETILFSFYYFKTTALLKKLIK